ncbi:SAM-dependent methyltransferase [Methylocaldum sp. MU1018]
MAFQLDRIVPWGRSFDEYVAMFALETQDFGRRILGCGDGPAGFNAELSSRGGSVVSVDPLYRFSADEIASRIDRTYDIVLEQTRQNAGEFVWSHIGSVEELGRIRLSAMRTFLADYPEGKRERRYLDAELPKLPFSDGAFDLTLCSHFLFLYSAQLGLDFHLRSLRELCRVAGEARVFPLLELGAVRSRHLDGAVSQLATEGYRTEIVKVPYEFQKGGHDMLIVRPPNPRKPLGSDAAVPPQKNDAAR